MERFLYRLSQSKHDRAFVLKGALMLRVWQIPQSRLTRDIDLLGFIANTAESLASIVHEVCLTPVVNDGLVFPVEAITTQPIRERADYMGVRANFVAQLGKSVLPMQIDVGFATQLRRPPKRLNTRRCLTFRHRICGPIYARRPSPRSFRQWLSWERITRG